MARSPARVLIVAALALLTVAPSALAAWPERPVTLVVASPAGGPVDAVARLVGPGMAAALGQPVVVQNVPGAAGVVGVERLVRSPPDGHTLALSGDAAVVTRVSMEPRPPYDPRRDLAPVGMAAHVPMVLAASPQSGVRDLQELLARIRERGEGVTFGTAGLGTTSHLAPALLLHLTGLKATLVSYRGAGPAMNDLAAGVVDAVIDQTVTMIPAHRGRTAVALAVSGARRVPQIPEVPTFAEAGVPAFDLVVWNAIAAPRGTPPAVVERLAAAVEAALADEELRRRLSDLAAVLPAPEERGPEPLQRRIASDIERWTAIVQASGIARQ